MYKVDYLLETVENEKRVYKLVYKIFIHQRDANSFIERIQRRFVSVKYIDEVTANV
jgi:hypothetical protein